MLSPFILEVTRNFPANIKKDIDILLSPLSYHPVWQTIEWQIMLLETKYAKKSFFVWVYEDKKLLSYALVEKRGIGWGYDGFFCVGGPVIGHEDSIEILSDTLKKLSLKEGVVFVQAEMLSSAFLSDFRTGHYKNFIEKHTVIINLTQDDEAILAHMKPKGRYNIRVAEKSGVEVEQVSCTKENLDVFYAILSETLERDGFAANSREYFRVFLRYLEKYRLGGLFFARREGRVIAVGIFVFYKKTALYYYGASSSDNAQRKYMASYLLQWKALQEAKNRGCEVFDFLGIAGPDEQHSPLAWVTNFKLKLTDNLKEWPKTQILVLKKSPYLMLLLKKKVKKYKDRLLGK